MSRNGHNEKVGATSREDKNGLDQIDRIRAFVSAKKHLSEGKGQIVSVGCSSSFNSCVFSFLFFPFLFFSVRQTRKSIQRDFSFLILICKIDSMLCNEGRRQAQQARKERDRTRRKLINMSFSFSSRLSSSQFLKRIVR